jgi:branched-chain amino acid transport system ATP-binding protein
MKEKILEIKNLKVNYGAIKALKGINLDVEKGSIVALLGANGAGKSTTLRAINGIVQVAEGKILLDGENISNQRIYKIAAKGIVQSPEGRLILNGLTVEENLKIGAYGLKPIKLDGKTISVAQRTKENFELVYKYFPILKQRKNQQANTLSGGEQQMLTIARSLMASPKILLLDEPSLGLAPIIVREIFDIILKLKSEGNTILIVEQNAYQTLKIADYAYVLELGSVSLQGTGEELLKNRKLAEAYLGSNQADQVKS